MRANYRTVYRLVKAKQCVTAMVSDLKAPGLMVHPTDSVCVALFVRTYHPFIGTWHRGGDRWEEEWMQGRKYGKETVYYRQVTIF